SLIQAPAASSFRGLSTRATTEWPQKSRRAPHRKTFRIADLRCGLQ
ncbi:MAG: hypothetical protein ACI875_002430, partial [Planctomycetota bacterium]